MSEMSLHTYVPHPKEEAVDGEMKGANLLEAHHHRDRRHSALVEALEFVEEQPLRERHE